MKRGKIITVGVLMFAGCTATGLWGDPESDRRIESDLASSYNFRTVLNDSVKADAADGIVTLTGTVEDRNQRALAEDTTRSTPGVADVRNHLNVSSPERERSDGWIALKIRSLLLVRPGVSATDTEVTVREGVVFLRGVAESVMQKELTETHARQVEGVRAVQNQIRVSEKRDDDPTQPLATGVLR